MDELLQEFIAETREMLAAISGEIVEWEADPSDRARLDEIFRFVHTVKGSCGFLDLPRLARLSHAAEDVLGDLRAGRRLPDTALVNAVLGVVDRIGELVEAIETGASLPDEDDHRLIAALATPAEMLPVGGGPAGAAAAEMLPAVAAPTMLHREPLARGVSRTVRLPIELLDRMMGGVSDMVLARNELSRKLRESGCEGEIELAFNRLSASVAEMRDAITRTRMQRIDNIFSALPRMVRDLSAELGKIVLLEIDGGDVELDREMIEMIRDPLTHIIRNAIDHGIESPEQRGQAGKPAAGRLFVSARQAGNQILIEVNDDGQGIDGERVARKAVAAGLLTPERAERLSWAQKVALIFEPGLTTAETVTTISGRGVGMDVVRANIERIGGLVDIESRPRIGLRIALRVPLTLTIIPALTVSAGGCNFAIPRAAIEEILRTNGDHVRIDRLGGGSMATIRGRRLPVVCLADLLGLRAGCEPAILVVVAAAGSAVYALALDAVHDHEELVVKPAAPAIMATGLYAGTTLPDNGLPMLLLDPAGIGQIAGVGAEQEALVAPAEAVAETVPTLLFRDLDGAERAIRLAVIERIDNVAPGAIARSGGRLRLVQDDRIVPLIACQADIPAGTVNVLRMCDGALALGYAVAGVIDIRALPVEAAPAVAPGMIGGVLLVDGRPIELLDPYWLFAQAAGASREGALARPAEAPLVLLDDATDPWTREVLRPLIAAAGYRVGFVGQGGDALACISTGGPSTALPADVPVIRLHGAGEGEQPPDSIYRYDRDALLGALRRRSGGAG